MLKQYFVGLGNPGEKYSNSRHDAGLMFLDFLIKKYLLVPYRADHKLEAEISANPTLILVKPQTFMNDSGRTVSQLVRYFPIELANQQDFPQLFVVHDDLDLELGNFKIQYASGPKVHNGINSVRSTIGDRFWNVRIGVDSRNGSRVLPGHEYVLAQLSPADKQKLEQVFSAVVEQLVTRKLVDKAAVVTG